MATWKERDGRGALVITAHRRPAAKPKTQPTALGKLEDFFSRPPSFAESLVPFWGPVRQAIPEFEQGHPWLGALDLGFAAADIVPGVDAASWGARAVERGVSRGFKRALTEGWSHTAVRRRLREAGVIKPGHVMHHGIIPSGRWGERVPNIIKNNSLNVTSLDRVTHARIHGASKGLPPLNSFQKTWLGTPRAVKVNGLHAGASVGSSTVGRVRGRDHAGR